jgi:hypothetical protein
LPRISSFTLPSALFNKYIKYGAKNNIPKTIANEPINTDVRVNLLLHMIQKPERVK